MFLPVVLYGCKISSPELREERRLWMVHNWVLREKFERLMEELIEDRHKLHDEELCDLYSAARYLSGD